MRFVDLNPFALHFVQGFVIGALQHKSLYFGAKSPLQLFRSSLGVLHCVMQNGSTQDVVVSDPSIGEDRGHFDRVIDIGDIAIFPTLESVLKRSEFESLGESDEGVRMSHFVDVDVHEYFCIIIFIIKEYGVLIE